MTVDYFEITSIRVDSITGNRDKNGIAFTIRVPTNTVDANTYIFEYVVFDLNDNLCFKDDFKNAFRYNSQELYTEERLAVWFMDFPCKATSYLKKIYNECLKIRYENQIFVYDVNDQSYLQELQELTTGLREKLPTQHDDFSFFDLGTWFGSEIAF
eukprot:Pgem_evm1s1722